MYYPSGISNEVLYDILNSTLASKPRVQDRIIRLGDDEYFINFHQNGTRNNTKLCELIAYSAGSPAEVFASRLDQENVSVEAMQANDGQEYLKGRMFFLCHDNHLIIAGDMSVRQTALERYLNQFLNKPAQMDINISNVVIADKARLIAANGVKAVDLKANLYAAQITEMQPESWLHRVIPSAVFQFTNAESLSQDENMLVNVSITFDRKTTQLGASFLESAANSVVNMEDDEVSYEIILGNKAGKIKSNELTYKRPVQIELNNGILSPSKVWSEMEIYFNDLITSGAIEGSD